MSDIDPRFEMLCQMMVQNAKTIARLEAENERLADAAEEIKRLRKALIKVCDRAHKVQVGCPSESFDIAIKEAKLMLNDTMPLAPFPNEPPFPSATDRR